MGNFWDSIHRKNRGAVPPRPPPVIPPLRDVVGVAYGNGSGHSWHWLKRGGEGLIGSCPPFPAPHPQVHIRLGDAKLLDEEVAHLLSLTGQ